MRYTLAPALAALLFFTACSKKDVRNDEALVTPEDNAGFSDEIAPPAQPAQAPIESAGDVAPVSNAMQTVYFPFDSYVFTQAAKDAIEANAAWLKQNPAAQVQIEGHCDERGTTEYNMALGERRADATRSYLQRLGIESSRVSTISYGEERPAVSGSGETNWSRNRRATFAVLR
jgi:peptidoglycan-associated lipoprotein